MKTIFKKFICNLFSHYDYKLKKSCVSVTKESLPVSRVAAIPGRRKLEGGREVPEKYRSLQAYSLVKTEIKCNRCGNSVCISDDSMQDLTAKAVLQIFKKALRLLRKTNGNEKRLILSAIEMYEAKVKALPLVISIRLLEFLKWFFFKRKRKAEIIMQIENVIDYMRDPKHSLSYEARMLAEFQIKLLKLLLD